MAAIRETEAAHRQSPEKPGESNQPGRNENEPRRSLENTNYQMAEPLVVGRRQHRSARLPNGGQTDICGVAGTAWQESYEKQLGKSSSPRRRNPRKQSKPYNQKEGKLADR